MKRIVGAVLTLALSFSLSLVATSASAEPRVPVEAGPTGQALRLTPHESVALARELDLATKSSTLTLGDVERTTYTLETGSTIVLEKPAPVPGQITPAWSVGVGWGFYLYLNQSDQRVLVAGGGAGLAVLICTATATVGCAAITAAVTGAAQWINDRGGICTGSLPYLEYRVKPIGTSTRCVASPG